MASSIAGCLGKTLGKIEHGTYPDGEISIKLLETVRGADVFVVQVRLLKIQKKKIQFPFIHHLNIYIYLNSYSLHVPLLMIT